MKRRSIDQQVSGLPSSTGVAITSQQSYAYKDIRAQAQKWKKKCGERKARSKYGAEEKNKGKVQRRQNLGDDVMNRGQGNSGWQHDHPSE
jgi:hypothetical protein